MSKTSEKPFDSYFHPIISARAHEEVVSQIIFSVLSGAYKPGERLPNIDALAQMMTVSKPVVVEAMKTLSASKLIRTQRGMNGGLIVNSDNLINTVPIMGMSLQHLALADIVEARKPIELQLCLLAARRAKPSDFEDMQTCITRLHKNRDADLHQRIRFDHLFHYTIGRAAQSGALALYQHQILEHLFLRMQTYFSELEDVTEVIEIHKMTLAAIRKGDPAEISRVVDIHLDPLEKAIAATSAVQESELDQEP